MISELIKTIQIFTSLYSSIGWLSKKLASSVDHLGIKTKLNIQDYCFVSQPLVSHFLPKYHDRSPKRSPMGIVNISLVLSTFPHWSGLFLAPKTYLKEYLNHSTLTSAHFQISIGIPSGPTALVVSNLPNDNPTLTFHWTYLGFLSSRSYKS